MKYIKSYSESLKAKKDPIIEYKEKDGKFYKRNPSGGKWVECPKSECDIKEGFVTDDNRGDQQTYPKYNQDSILKATEYVDQVFSGGSGPEVVAICKEIGCDRPTDDDSLEEIREKAIQYFIENPERIGVGKSEFKTYPFNGGDGIPRTNNIGGVHESYRPGPKEADSVSAPLTQDEMKLFGKESSLINLNKSNKISLRNKEVWFKKDDERTKKILNMYFDIDKKQMDDPKTNEGMKFISR